MGPSKVLEGMVVPVSNSRVERAAALERWADDVATEDLVQADTTALREIAELVEQSNVDHQIVDAVRSARRSNRSWAEIGAMLGVSEQAAQQKYGPLVATS